MGKLRGFTEKRTGVWLHIREEELDAFYEEVLALGLLRLEDGELPKRSEIGPYMVLLGDGTLCGTTPRCWQKMKEKAVPPRMAEYSDLPQEEN